MNIKQNGKVPTMMWKMGILDRAIKQYGVEAQLDMLVEECSELILAIQHMKRKRCGWKEVAEKIADVRIITSQFHTLDGVSDQIHLCELKKLEHLEKRLDAKNTMSDV